MVLCLLLFFGGQFRLVNYFDSEIVRSLSAYFGKTRSEIGYSRISLNVSHVAKTESVQNGLISYKGAATNVLTESPGIHSKTSALDILKEICHILLDNFISFSK